MLFAETRDRVIFIPAAVAVTVLVLACFGVYEVVRLVCTVLVSILSGSPLGRFL